MIELAILVRYLFCVTGWVSIKFGVSFTWLCTLLSHFWCPVLWDVVPPYIGSISTLSGVFVLFIHDYSRGCGWFLILSWWRCWGCQVDWNFHLWICCCNGWIFMFDLNTCLWCLLVGGFMCDIILFEDIRHFPDGLYFGIPNGYKWGCWVWVGDGLYQI